MSRFYDYPYTDVIPMIIGRQLPGNGLTYANVGIFGSGYMQFGVIGMIAFPFIAGLSFKFIDRLVEPDACLRRARGGLHCGNAILEGDLTGVFLSHGLNGIPDALSPRPSDPRDWFTVGSLLSQDKREHARR